MRNVASYTTMRPIMCSISSSSRDEMFNDHRLELLSSIHNPGYMLVLLWGDDGKGSVAVRGAVAILYVLWCLSHLEIGHGVSIARLTRITYTAGDTSGDVIGGGFMSIASLFMIHRCPYIESNTLTSCDFSSCRFCDACMHF